MTIDFTKNINNRLSLKDLKKYKILRIFVVILFLLGAFYFSYLVLFPIQNFVFDFANPNAAKNTVKEVKSSDGKLTSKGMVAGNDLFSFNASTPERFSSAKVTFVLNGKSAPENSQLQIRKSYLAYLYPDASNSLPPGQLDSRDGTLLSFGDAVYVLSQNVIYPVGDPIIFSSMGYNWDDVTPASEDELGSYEKGKLISLFSPHPSGTILVGRESGQYYYIYNGRRYKITADDLKNHGIKRTPIMVDEKSLDTLDTCQFKKNIWPFNSYSCIMNISNLTGLIGKDYDFKFMSQSDIQIKNIEVSLSRDIDWPNLKFTLSEIKKKMLSQYGNQQ